MMHELNQLPCPYCGCFGGFHMWAGAGSCPGSDPQIGLIHLILKRLNSIDARLSAIETNLKPMEGVSVSHS